MSTVGYMRPSGRASATTDASIARADWPRLAFEPKPGAPPHSCGVCGKPEALMCKACRTAYFCSVDCQRVAWRGGHKAECRERAAMYTELLRREAVDEDVSDVARARSLYELACSHLEGIGCAADKSAYIRTMREAVAAGSHDAAAIMATYFRDGDAELGVARNAAEYVRLLRVAADSEVLLRGEPTVQPAAQHELGLVLVRGTEVPADLPASVRYFKRAADAGFAMAQLSYGLCLLDGSGTDWRMPVRASATFTSAETTSDTASANAESIFSGGKSGNKLPYIPEWAASAGLGVEYRGLGVYLDATYTGEMFGTASNSSNLRTPSGKPDARYGVTDQMFIVDLSVQYQVTENIRLLAGISNLTDDIGVTSRLPFGARSNAPRSYFGGVEIRF